jgi:hypothetical protein
MKPTLAIHELGSRQDKGEGAVEGQGHTRRRVNCAHTVEVMVTIILAPGGAVGECGGMSGHAVVIAFFVVAYLVIRVS